MAVDVIVILIITISIMICAKRGFAMSVFSVGAVFASAILAVLFCRPFTDFVRSSPPGLALSEAVGTRVGDMFLSTGSNAVYSSNLPEFARKLLYSGTETVSEAAAILTDKIVGIIITVVSFLLLVCLIKLASTVSSKTVKTVVSLPVLKQFDKLLGAVCGIAAGLVLAIIAVYVIGLVSLVPAFDFLNEQIAGSMFLKTMYGLKIGELLF